MSELKAPDIEVGDRVVDANPKGAPSAMRIADVPGTRADEFYIAAIDKTVAKENSDYPADDPVVGVIYENDLEAEDAEQAARDGTDATVYHYPASRTKPVSEDWQPTVGARRSSGRREREETFGEHEDAVGRFVEDLRRALSEPEAVAEETLDMLAVNEAAGVENAEHVMQDMTSPGGNIVLPRPVDDPPQTRGECQYSQNDRYRPGDDDAMCCWECSNRSHNRPEKFERQDSAGEVCNRNDQSAWKLRDSVMKNIDLSGLPDGLRRTYDGDSRRLVRDISALRSHEPDRIRKAALRMAYRPHLEDVEEYNYNRALALLRDRGVAAELPIIGDNGGGSQ